MSLMDKIECFFHGHIKIAAGGEEFRRERASKIIQRYVCLRCLKPLGKETTFIRHYKEAK